MMRSSIFSKVFKYNSLKFNQSLIPIFTNTSKFNFTSLKESPKNGTSDDEYENKTLCSKSCQNCPRQADSSYKYRNNNYGIFPFASIFLVGCLGGIILFYDTFAQMMSRLTSEWWAEFFLRMKKKEQNENVKLCCDSIREFADHSAVLKTHNELKEGDNTFTYDTKKHFEDLLNKKAMCIRGPYGSGTTYFTLNLANLWQSQKKGKVIYFKPHSIVTYNSIADQLFFSVNAKDEKIFLKSLDELKKNKEEVLLIMDNLDAIDLEEQTNTNFIEYLKNLQEDGLLHTIYIFRRNKTEIHLSKIYQNEINMFYLGLHEYIDYQTEDQKNFIKNYCNLDRESAEKFLFFFGLNFKNMKEYNYYINSYRSDNKIEKNFNDYIDVKIDKLVDNVQMKGITSDVLRLCPSIDNDGLFSSDWKKKLTHAQILKLQLEDVLIIHGTTSPLYRAAISKLCNQNWRNWDLKKFKAKWNVEYYL